MKIIWAVALCVIISCGAHAQRAVRAHVIVYKTKRDYRTYVPVTLSDDKTKVVSYPDPADIKMGSGYPLPISLHKGYLLDRRGIGINTAFIKMTYAQYAALKSVPDAAQLYGMILDKDPIKELYDCGTRDAAKNTEALLDKAIDHGVLKKKFKRIK